MTNDIQQAFAWEPVSNKFGIISGELPSVNVTFFQVNKGHAPTELKKLEKRPCNNLFWSPQGQFVVLAGLRNMSGALEFIDTRDFQVCTYLMFLILCAKILSCK